MKKPVLSVLAVAAVVILTAGSVQARPVPDAGSTVSMFGPILLGLAAIRRFLKK
ncbi:MAG TPA: VPDSG-CTERM sorting domain-containing protein [Verrucomicrobiae bacterium]|jgi:hypothetical protein